MKKTLKNALLGITSAAALASTVKAADFSGNLKYFHNPENNAASYPEINLWVSDLPGKLKDYSWMDFNKDGTYFGKSEVSREVGKNFNGVVQAVHGNKPLTQAGLGVSYDIPFKQNSPNYATVKVLPVWINREGETLPGNALIGAAAGHYFGDTGLLRGINLEMFFEANINGPRKEEFKGKRNFSWGYGELELSRKMGPNLKVALNAGLYNQGNNKLPEAKARIEARYDFSFKVPFWKKFESKK